MADEEDTRRHLVTVHDPEAFDAVKAALSLNYALSYPTDKNGKPGKDIYGEWSIVHIPGLADFVALNEEGEFIVRIRDEQDRCIQFSAERKRAAAIAFAMLGTSQQASTPKLCEEGMPKGGRVFFRGPVREAPYPTAVEVPDEPKSVLAVLLIAIAILVVMAFGAIAWELLS